MPKLKLSAPNGRSFCQLTTNSGGVINIKEGILGKQAKPSSINNYNHIEIKNNHHLTVTDSTIHLVTINLTSGTIDLHNSYVVHNGKHTNVVIGKNSTLNITGADICIGSFMVNLNSTLNFTHNGHNYIFQTPNYIGIIGHNASVIVQNMDKLVTICEFINNKWVNDSDFALEELCYLRDYQKLDPNFVSLFMEQNKMVSTDAINHFITQNYFEFADITHNTNLTGSTLEGVGSYNITEEICSWLKLYDVNLFGDTASEEV